MLLRERTLFALRFDHHFGDTRGLSEVYHRRALITG